MKYIGLICIWKEKKKTFFWISNKRQDYPELLFSVVREYPITGLFVSFRSCVFNAIQNLDVKRVDENCDGCRVLPVSPHNTPGLSPWVVDCDDCDMEQWHIPVCNYTEIWFSLISRASSVIFHAFSNSWWLLSPRINSTNILCGCSCIEGLSAFFNIISWTLCCVIVSISVCDPEIISGLVTGFFHVKQTRITTYQWPRRVDKSLVPFCK